MSRERTLTNVVILTRALMIERNIIISMMPSSKMVRLRTISLKNHWLYSILDKRRNLQVNK